MEPQNYRFPKLTDHVIGIVLPENEVRTLYAEYLKTKRQDLISWCVFLTKHKVEFFVFTVPPKKWIAIE